MMPCPNLALHLVTNMGVCPRSYSRLGPISKNEIEIFSRKYWGEQELKLSRNHPRTLEAINDLGVLYKE